jgi:hypothetical protein
MAPSVETGRERPTFWAEVRLPGVCLKASGVGLGLSRLTPWFSRRCLGSLGVLEAVVGFSWIVLGLSWAGRRVPRLLVESVVYPEVVLWLPVEGVGLPEVVLCLPVEGVGFSEAVLWLPVEVVGFWEAILWLPVEVVVYAKVVLSVEDPVELVGGPNLVVWKT